MSAKEEVKKVAEILSKGLAAGLMAGHSLAPKPPRPGEQDSYDYVLAHHFCQAPDIPMDDIELKSRLSVVVGLDLKEWTKRGFPEQLISAVIMHSCIARAMTLLRTHGVLTDDDPIFVNPTGDGAYFVFDAEDDTKNSATAILSIGKAVMFILTLNILLVEQDIRASALAQFPYGRKQSSVLPIHSRFALTMDRLIYTLDWQDSLVAIGPALVTCARILSTDHGNHFLVHDLVVNVCRQYGGLAAVAAMAGTGDWNAHFHHSEMPETAVKSNLFRYYDVFGHYSDTPLLRLHGRRLSPSREYHIGSHDVGRLDVSG